MKRSLTWDIEGWNDYLYWQSNDKSMLKRINKIITDFLRDPFNGIGKTEHLKGNLSGLISRRINDEYRLIYKVYDDRILIIKCRYHY
ncbi:MAG: Txe/YoeB family addiction module toxin [Saprospiraceae bacterium]|nr:Txe/YoeB family addiction module toxin [Saprospiraceae bacterium]